MPACLEQVRRGDEEAARQLFHHLYPLVIKVVRSHLPRRTSEDDLTQTIFMKVFANLAQFSGRVPLEALGFTNRRQHLHQGVAR